MLSSTLYEHVSVADWKNLGRDLPSCISVGGPLSAPVVLVAAGGASCGLSLIVYADLISYVPTRLMATTRCLKLADLAYWQSLPGDIALGPGPACDVEHIPRGL